MLKSPMIPIEAAETAAEWPLRCDFPRQVGHEEGHVEAAGEEPGVQADVAAVPQGGDHLGQQARAPDSVRRAGRLGLRPQGPGERNGEQGCAGECDHGSRPPEGAHDRLGKGRENELAERPARR